MFFVFHSLTCPTKRREKTRVNKTHSFSFSLSRIILKSSKIDKWLLFNMQVSLTIYFYYLWGYFFYYFLLFHISSHAAAANTAAPFGSQTKGSRSKIDRAEENSLRKHNETFSFWRQWWRFCCPGPSLVYTFVLLWCKLHSLCCLPLIFPNIRK